MTYYKLQIHSGSKLVHECFFATDEINSVIKALGYAHWPDSIQVNVTDEPAPADEPLVVTEKP